MAAHKAVLLTGDTPTGQLHLGHYLGSLENRVLLQDDYDCNFCIANTHAFTTRLQQSQQIHQSVLDIACDYLAAGIDPERSCIFIESEVSAIYEFSCWASMLLPFTRVMRNPTIKDEIRDKDLGDNYSFGFPLYAVMQVADILALRAEIVPVGEDQLPHLEMTREVARRFNQIYAGVDPHTKDEDYMQAGGILPIPQAKLGRIKRLVGLGGPGKNGQLLKMSKSLNNTILLRDDADTVHKKIMGMYTDPKRLKATDPGTIENNPLWIFHDIFNPDTTWVADAKEKYMAGNIGDVACKKALSECIIDWMRPIQQRYQLYTNDLSQVIDILKTGSMHAQEQAATTVRLVKQAMHQIF
jgi:tryptophanyl-tRNA synthetase